MWLQVLLERPLTQQALLIAAAALSLAALDYVFVYRHQAGSIARAAGDLALVRLDETRLRAELSRLPGLREELAALRAELSSTLPRGSRAATPLETIAARADAAGLEVVRFHPGEAEVGEHFSEVPMAVELGGTFHELLRFFDLSAGSDHRLNARDLAIDAHAADDGHMTLRIELEMAAIRLQMEDAGDAAEDRTGVVGSVHEAPTLPMEDAGDAAGNRTTPDTAAGAHALVHRQPAEFRRAGPDTAAPAPTPTREPAETETWLRDPFQPYQPPPAPHDPDPPMEPTPPPEGPAAPVPEPRFHAVGIVWEPRAAVALVKDADGFGHVVEPGEPLDALGYQVKAITSCEVVLETTRNDPQPRETRLRVPRCGDPAGPARPDAEP